MRMNVRIPVIAVLMSLLLGPGTELYAATWTTRPVTAIYPDRVATDAVGSNLIACENGWSVYISGNSGASWTESCPLGAGNCASDPTPFWYGVASDDDGSNLAAVDNGGFIYVSANSGASWTARDSQRSWWGVSSDADGSYLAAVTYDTGAADYIYLSSNSGANWTAQTHAGLGGTPAGNRNWHAIAIDADGSHIAAGVYSGYIYTSSDSGATWVERTGAGSRVWESIASSSNGAVLIAVSSGAGRVFTSYDAGATWTERCPTGTCVDRNWGSAASDADGSHLVAGVVGGRLYVSRNYGVSWTEEFPLGGIDSNWLGADASSDGSFLVVANNTANVYTGVQSSTLIELAGFAAGYTGESILLAWQTASETDNVGFHLWRSDAADGVYTRITNQLIPATGSTAQGGVYSFTDADVLRDGTYFYKLEDVDTAGVSTFNGPVQADMSSISLIAPTGDEAVPSQYRARFSWKSAPYTQFRVQFSNLEDFSAGVLTLPTTPNPSFKRVALRDGFSVIPSVGRWRKIKRLSGTDGTLYWRVVGKEENGTLRPSAAGILRIR